MVTVEVTIKEGEKEPDQHLDEAEHIEPEQAAAGCQVLFEAVLARANRVL